MTERRGPRPIDVHVGTLVVERSPGRLLTSLQPALRRELIVAGVPSDVAGDVAAAVLDAIHERGAG